MSAISLVECLLRIFVACQYLESGAAKAMNWQSTVAQFTHEYTMPLWAPAMLATLCMIGEIVGALLLLLGKFLRSGCTTLLVMNCIAVSFHPSIWSLSRPGPLQVRLFASAYLLVVIAWGPGRYCLDARGKS